MSELTAPEGLAHLGSGKVRDLYEVDDGHLLLVASDRISAFDVVLDDPARPPEASRLARIRSGETRRPATSQWARSSP